MRSRTMFLRTSFFLFIVVFAFAGIATDVHADQRVALVIGNSAYQHTGKLDNPKNDAADMAAVLKQLGFQVIDGYDLDEVAFKRKLRDFSTALRGAEVGLFFFAGHGLQVAGQNYLFPVDAKGEAADALEWEMVSLELVQKTMEYADTATTKIIFLDACRDNPLARNLARAIGTRSAGIGRGLAQVDASVGTLISFSTQPGNVASDGAGRNSPFTGALVKRIATSNDDLSALLIDVRNDVRKETQNAQVPWEHSSLTGRFYFSPSARPAPSAGSAPQPSPQPQPSDAAQAWAAAERSTDPTVLEAFIKHYGETFYGTLARSRLAELKRQQVAVAEPPKAPSPPTAISSAGSTAQRFTMATPLTIRLGDTFPTGDTSSRNHLYAIVNDLTTLSGGNLKIDLLPANAVAPAFQMLDVVSNGALDAAWTVPSYWYGRGKAFGILSGTVPGGLNAAAFIRWMEAEGARELNRLIAEVTNNKARSLPCAVIGPGGDWFKKTIVKTDDFRGLKFRAVGLSIEVGKEIGAAVTVLSVGEIVPAMNTGLLDGSDWPSPESATKLGLPVPSKILHYPSWGRTTQLFELLINEGVWDRLGRDAQQGFEVACRHNLQRSLARISELERQAMAEL